MDVRELCNSIPEFSTWTDADRIRLFAWFLHTYGGLGSFTVEDIRGCYASLTLAPPSSISPFLRAMATRKPPELMKNSQGFVLELRVRQKYDASHGQRAATVHVHKLLTDLPSKIPNLAERGYLEEALICFRYKAFRAALVMVWNLVFDHLCEIVLSRHLSAFNTQLPVTYPRADIKTIAKREDFHELKESQVLQVCKSARIIPDTMHKILQEKLTRRNMAAHPSGVTILESTAEEVIRDLIENVLLKLV